MTKKQTFEAEIHRLLHLREAHKIIRMVVHEDPDARFSREFNLAMKTVFYLYIHRALLLPQAALAAKIDAGEIKSFDQLIQTMTGIIRMVGLQLSVKSYHRANPRLCPGRRTATATGHSGSTLPLIVQGRWSLNPSAKEIVSVVRSGLAIRGEYLALLLAEGRWLGSVRFRLLREAYAYEEEHGSTHGCIPFLARLAILDATGQVVGLRRSGVSEAEGRQPTAATVRRVRRIYQEACRYVENRAYFRGLGGRPPS